MTYARLRSAWTGRVITVGPFADPDDVRAFAPPDLSQQRAAGGMPEGVVDDRATLEAAGALPMTDYTVEIAG